MDREDAPRLGPVYCLFGDREKEQEGGQRSIQAFFGSSIVSFPVSTMSGEHTASEMRRNNPAVPTPRRPANDVLKFAIEVGTGDNSADDMIGDEEMEALDLRHACAPSFESKGVGVRVPGGFSQRHFVRPS